MRLKSSLIALAAATAVALSACSSGTPAPEDSTPAPGNTAESTENGGGSQGTAALTIAKPDDDIAFTFHVR